MNCRFCNGEMDEDVLICPNCGKDNALQEVPAEEIPAEVLPTAEASAEEAVAEEVAAEEAAEQAFSAEEAVAEEFPAEEAVAEEAPVAPKKKTWVKVTAIVLAVVLVLGIAAGIWYQVNGGFMPRANDVYRKDNYTVSAEKAQKAADKVVATVEGRELNNGHLQAQYWMQVFNFLNNYGSYLSYMGMDYTQPLAEQFITDGGATWEQFFLQSALETWHRYQAIVLLAEKDGYALPEELQTYLAEMPAGLEESAVAYGYADAAEMVAQEMGPGCRVEDYVAYWELYYTVSGYLESLYAQITPSEEEVKAHVTANAEEIQSNYSVSMDSGKLVDVRHILIQPEGCEFNEMNHVVATEEQWSACQAEAQKLLDAWKAGSADETSFAELAAAHSVDGSASNGGLYTDVYVGQMVEAFEDWCFDESRQYGDTGLVRTEYGYHIMYYVAGEEGWLRYGRMDLQQKECSEIIEQAIIDYPMEVKFKSVVLGQADLTPSAG